MDNEFLLMDRLQKIRSIIEKYGEDNFYLSFSGGKDSTVLSALLDMALPGNKIPRVYANTGLDMLEKYFPTERKQCEIIWKPVYDEYRRLGYRLRKKESEE